VTDFYPCLLHIRGRTATGCRPDAACWVRSVIAN